MKIKAIIKATTFTYTAFVASILFLISCGGCGSGKTTIAQQVSQSTESTPSKPEEDSTKKDLPTSSSSDIGLLENAPILPMQEVDITEVCDKFILRDTVNPRIYHFYDGHKVQTIDFSDGWNYLRVSKNGKYISKAQYFEDENTGKTTMEVELRDYTNRVIARQMIQPYLTQYSEDDRDEIIPFEDGSGFLHIGRFVGDGLWIVGYKLNKGRFSKIFQLKRQIGDLLDVQMDKNAEKLVILHTERVNGLTVDTIMMYDMDKGLLWKNVLPIADYSYSIRHQFDDSRVMYSDSDIYLFKSGIDSTKVLRFDFQGNIVDSFKVLGILTHWEVLRNNVEELLMIYTHKVIGIYKPTTKEVLESNLGKLTNLSKDLTLYVRNSIINTNLEKDNIIISFYVVESKISNKLFSGLGIISVSGELIKMYNLKYDRKYFVVHNDNFYISKYPFYYINDPTYLFRVE
jgi:hypothetical protein